MKFREDQRRHYSAHETFEMAEKTSYRAAGCVNGGWTVARLLHQCGVQHVIPKITSPFTLVHLLLIYGNYMTNVIVNAHLLFLS